MVEIGGADGFQGVKGTVKANWEAEGRKKFANCSELENRAVRNKNTIYSCPI
jgi:hypothetical protein